MPESWLINNRICYYSGNLIIASLLDYADLVKKADDASARYHDLSEKIKAAEKRMAEIAVMKTHIETLYLLSVFSCAKDDKDEGHKTGKQ